MPRRYLGLVPARAGSKRLPGKNTMPLHGRPLLAWSIDAALACPAVAMTLVSTDSQAIADVAIGCGARAPFLRPAALAGDASTSADAALHALDWLRDAEGAEFDAVVLLEPTSPVRASTDVAGVVARMEAVWEQADAVVTVGRVDLEQPRHMQRLDGHGLLRPWLAAPGSHAPTAAATEDDAAPWFPYGVAYCVKVEALRRWCSFYPPRVAGYRLARWQHYEVDDLYDFACVAAIFAHFDGKLP